MAKEIVDLQPNNVKLKKLYWQAGIPEYWLVDARQEIPRFEKYRHQRAGYVAARKQSGWVFSEVLSHSFQLTVVSDEFGYPKYRVGVK